MEYTEPQRAAVTGQFKQNVLVSASAGSGKTRVLVDRVLNKIITDHINIDELLIVTFTKAAAKEMRDRLEQALRTHLNTETEAATKSFLVRQLRRLPVADISTMDAFCQKIVQNYYYIIDLDPEFRLLADQTETQMLKEQVWEKVREDLYANDTDGKFAQLTENFSNDRSDDGLTDLVFKIYDYANVNQDPIAWLKKTPQLYQVLDHDLVGSTFYQQQCLPVLANALEQPRVALLAAQKLAQDQQLSREIDVLANDLTQITDLKNNLATQPWDALKHQAEQVKFKRFPSATKSYDDIAKEYRERIKNTRTQAKKVFTKVVEKYFNQSEAANLALMQTSQILVKKLVQVVLTFSDQYQQVKLQRHCLEFIDVEHYAYQILAGNGIRSKNIRTKLQQQYNEIMVDEYQDNNRLQDAILSTLANHNAGNMFMVGDVKQSIYRFRLADPSMFVHRMDDPDNDTIVLPDNFRSMANIDHFINLIFTQIMDRQWGEIDYTGDAKLKVGATYYPDELQSQVDIMLYESQSQQDTIVDNQFQVQDSAHGQIEMIAQKIKAMMNDKTPIFDRNQQCLRPIQYSDIAIISATRNNNMILSDILGAYEIPLQLNGAQSYFKTTEIQIMMAMLSIIDNPYQDIPLVAVLRSPLVGLNENQLAYLRINTKTGDYFNAVTHFYHHYVEMPTTEFGDQVFARVQRFLEQLHRFQDIAHRHAIVDLIWAIYEETGFLDYVGGMPAGKQRQANLHALYERASEYERTSFKGLFQFVRFIRRMQERNEDLDEAAADEQIDAVSVMTIHGSKGLEFPVVFLMDASHGFNTQDTKQTYVLNDQLGLGITYMDPTTRIKQTTLQHQVVTAMENKGLLAEEMRKLYVALTRAEQHLIIVGATKAGKDRNKVLDAWQQAASGQQLLVSAALRSGAKSYLDWIGPALVRHPRFQEQFGNDSDVHLFDNDPTKFTVRFVNAHDLAQKAVTGDQKQNKQWLQHLAQQAQTATIPAELNVDDIKQVLNLQYVHQVATHTTAYQAVSEIKRLFDDPDNLQLGNYDVEWTKQKQRSRYVNQDFKTPRFMQTASQVKSTDIGTATHLLLQQLDLHTQPTIEQVQSLLDQLTADQIITPEVAQRIKIHEVVQVFASPLGKMMLSHIDDLHREAPFAMLIKANRIFQGFDDQATEQVLIHGIVDGYIEFSDHVVLFDYKTDYIPYPGNMDQVETIVTKYRGQINLYAKALENILHKPVTEKYLYLLSINRLYQIKADEK
jgi:ATP-dependent helicase/nuclease subunit A